MLKKAQNEETSGTKGHMTGLLKHFWKSQLTERDLN